MQQVLAIAALVAMTLAFLAFVFTLPNLGERLAARARGSARIQGVSSSHKQEA